MPDQRTDLVRKMIAEGTSDDDIRATLKAFDAQSAPKPTTPEPSMVDRLLADNAAMPIGLRAVQGVLRAAKAHPVTAGAMIGGTLAAPLTGGASIPAAMAAAGLGAAGGAGAAIAGRQLATGVPESGLDTAKTMLSEGAAGAAGEGIGQGIGRGAMKAGKLVYKAALRPSMGLQREFGDVAATGLAKGATVSESGARGIQSALGENSAEVQRLLDAAQQAGASPVTTREVAGEFGDVFKQGQRQAQLGRPDPRPDVLQRLAAFDARNPNGIRLNRAQELKGEAQDLASRAYRAEDRGGPLTDLSAASDKAMASGLRKGIETRVPAAGPINADSQQMIGLLRAIEDATRRNVPGVGSLRTLLGDFMPAVSSRGGIQLDRLGRSTVPPAAFRTALLAALGQGQSP